MGECGKLATVYSAANPEKAATQDIALTAFRMNAQGIAEPIDKTNVRTTDPSAKLDVTATPGKAIGVDTVTVGPNKVMNAAVHQACPAPTR